MLPDFLQHLKNKKKQQKQLKEIWKDLRDTNTNIL